MNTPLPASPRTAQAARTRAMGRHLRHAGALAAALFGGLRELVALNAARGRRR